jgi:hypothetical protein
MREKKLHEVHADLVGETELHFNDGPLQFDQTKSFLAWDMAIQKNS